MRRFFQFALPALMSVVLFGATVFIFILPRMEEAIMAKKRETVRELVRTVVDLLKTYQANVESGGIDLGEAQQRALARIQCLRYGPEMKDYFWINDLTPRMLVHPYRSDLNRQDLRNVTDPNGKKLFVAMVQQATAQGGGFVEYLWQHHDNPNKIVPKVSYVALFKPWGWIIGSGLYYDDVRQEIAKITRNLVLVGIGVLMLGSLLSAYLAFRGMSVMKENQRMMASLRHSEAKFRGISSSAHDGIIMIDSNGLVNFWNPAAEKIFGYREDEIMGRDLHKLLASGNQYQKYASVIKRFRADGTGDAIGKTIELLALHKEGKEIPIELSVSALSFENKWHAVGVVRDISEKKKAAASLQESETKYRSLFESTHDIIFLIKGDRIVDCNARAMEFFQIEKEKILGRTPMELSPPYQADGELTAAVGRRYFDLVMQGEPQHFEWTHRRNDGELVDTDVVLKKITMLGEDLLLGVSRDITDRKKMALERERTASLLVAAIEQAQAGVIIVDASDGRLLHVNKAALQMLGETPELLNPDRKRLARASWRILDTNGHMVDIENQPLRLAYSKGVVTANQTYLIERSDKTRIWIEVNASPVRDKSGHIIYGVVFFTDISERIQTEVALRRLNQFQESIIENANVWMTVHDPGGNAILWNKAAETISGYERTSVIGGSDIWTRLYPAETERNRVLKIITEVIRSGCAVSGDETDIRCHDGRIKTISWHIRRLGDEGSSQPEALCLGYDVTETKHLQNQLVQTQKLEAVGTLAAGIAHDFNNILWGILGFSELALGQIKTNPEKALNSVRQVLEAGNRAKYMVQQILQFSRQSEIAIGPLDVTSILKEVTKLLKATVPANYEIRLALSNNVGWVHADPTQLHQVIMNLATNAYHAMQPFDKGVLSFSLDMLETDFPINCQDQNLPAGKYVRLQIADTGTGIDPENFDKIFDPYFTTKKQSEGTGLGLAVSYGIIKAHHGGIQVDSRKGEGTCFSIYLPARRDAAVEVILHKEESRGGTEHILCVDDEKPLTKMTEDMLKRMGYTVTAFCSSPEALDYFTSHAEEFDLVITDQAMPKMTGLALAAKIKAIHPRTPIILCTGFSEHITAENLERSGISMILKKPVTGNDLSLSIRKILDENKI
ncbi:MAG: PAS domain S-box protein [Thermodesulfobacteriota bacterium]